MARSGRAWSTLFCACLLATVGLPRAAFAGTLAQFRTPLGTMDVELFDDAKPVTVQNFLRYVKSGAYSNMFMHRWVPGFVIQGGGFVVARRSNTNLIEQVPSFGEITNEFSVGRVESNRYGTLAMARVGGATNSATSQWFFNLANNTGLDNIDGGFTVFGRVVRGTNVLNRFNNLSSTNKIYWYPLGGVFNELPVLSLTPTFQDLVYVDISLLNVQVTAWPSGEREIAWTSVINLTNHLEFTTVMPPNWRVLFSAKGTGATMNFRDSDNAAALRFYRVRVDY